MNENIYNNLSVNSASFNNDVQFNNINFTNNNIILNIQNKNNSFSNNNDNINSNQKNTLNNIFQLNNFYSNLLLNNYLNYYNNNSINRFLFSSILVNNINFPFINTLSMINILNKSRNLNLGDAFKRNNLNNYNELNELNNNILQ